MIVMDNTRRVFQLQAMTEVIQNYYTSTTELLQAYCGSRNTFEIVYYKTITVVEVAL